MIPETHRTVDEAMRKFRRTGKKEYRKRQYKALCELLNDIFDHEPNCRGKVKSIGWRQLTGYYKRHSHFKLDTLVQKWRVLSLLFQELGLKEPLHPSKVVKKLD